MSAKSSQLGDFCNRKVATVRRRTSIESCAQLIHDEHSGAVVAVDARGALTGMVSADDLLALMASEMDGLVALVRAEETQERVTRAGK